MSVVCIGGLSFHKSSYLLLAISYLVSVKWYESKSRNNLERPQQTTHHSVNIYFWASSAFVVVPLQHAWNFNTGNLVEREYWVFPLHMNHEKERRFEKSYNSIRKYLLIFFQYYRMLVKSYDELLEFLRPVIMKMCKILIVASISLENVVKFLKNCVKLS